MKSIDKAQQYKERAKLWNTSEKWLQLKEEEMTDLTNFQNHYHTKINKLKDDYYLSTISITTHHLHYKGEISDDTKELERRPNKKNTLYHTDFHLNHDRQMDKIKKLKLPDPNVEECIPSTSY
ncbi:hypothetical protein RhiirA4_465171 [Rhizophagus irregularis]|uniref:Peptidase C30 domain-containing protein n=1 Tax=Rhizophagus irregularis TaxID=588596 RepID=A0A2I1GRU0_9GLOM|nr:hypothetical protein RhiirA4_465171 [Rhizophagus irregularis]